MKRTFQIVSAAVLLTVASVTAQAQPGRGMAAQKEAMMKEITVTPAISAQIDTIMATASKKMMDARAAGTQMTPEDRKKMNDERNAAIKKLLTADQATQFQKNVDAMPVGGRGRGGL
ncbi:MAG: hypothetical protein ABJC26_04715 [Gemmatimonadaceae bacterium]